MISASVGILIRRVSRSSLAPAFNRRSAFRIGALAGLSAVTFAATSSPSVAAANTRDRSANRLSASSSSSSSSPSSASSGATVVSGGGSHWALDGDGITAQQRAMSKVTDPIERLQLAGTRELLQAAVHVPGVVAATLANESTADTAAAASATASATLVTVEDDERVFLQRMEAEYGRDVLPLLRRQEWRVRITFAANVTAARTASAAATVVCYFQEGTQRILWKRLDLA